MSKREGIMKLTKEDKVYRAIAFVILGMIMISIIYPMWFVLVASFANPLEIYDKPFLIWPKEFSFKSYEMVFNDKDFLIGFRNSILYTLIGTTVNVVMNICGAYPLSRKKFKGKKFLMIMFTFTMFFSGGLIPTYLVIDSLGLIDSFWVMIIPSAVGMFNIIIMRTYFQSIIPQELEEAAKVDGCTNFGLLIKIVLPLSAPIIAVIALYYGVGRWNEYFGAMIYLSDRALYPLQLVLREILLQNQASDMMNIVSDAGYSDRMIARMGLKYATIIVSTVPIFIIFPLVQRFFGKGVMVGALKG